MKMMKGQTLELPVEIRDANKENDERIDTRITGRKKDANNENDERIDTRITGRKKRC